MHAISVLVNPVVVAVDVVVLVDVVGVADVVDAVVMLLLLLDDDTPLDPEKPDPEDAPESPEDPDGLNGVNVQTSPRLLQQSPLVAQNSSQKHAAISVPGYNMPPPQLLAHERDGSNPSVVVVVRVAIVVVVVEEVPEVGVAVDVEEMLVVVVLDTEVVVDVLVVNDFVSVADVTAAVVIVVEVLVVLVNVALVVKFGVDEDTIGSVVEDDTSICHCTSPLSVVVGACISVVCTGNGVGVRRVCL